MANAIVQATTFFDDAEEDRRGLEGPGRPDARHRARGDPRAGATRRPRLVGGTTPRTAATSMKIGVLALQGAFREHLDTLAAIGVEGVRVREPADLEGVSGLILPGGESTTMRQLIERWGLREPILDLAEPRRPDLRDVRRDDRPGRRDRRRRGADPAAPRRHRRAQRVRAPARLVRGRPLGPGPRRHARSTPSSSAPRSSSGPGPASTSWPGSTTAGSSPSASATSSPPRSIPSSPARRASTGSSRRWPPSTTTRARARAGAPPDAPRAAGRDDRAAARPRSPGKVRAARLTDLAALGELSRLCQSDGAGDPLARACP